MPLVHISFEHCFFFKFIHFSLHVTLAYMAGYFYVRPLTLSLPFCLTQSLAGNDSQTRTTFTLSY